MLTFNCFILLSIDSSGNKIQQFHMIYWCFSIAVSSLLASTRFWMFSLTVEHHFSVNRPKQLPFGHLTKVMVLPVAIYLLTDTIPMHNCRCQALKVTGLILVNDSHHSLPI